MSAKIFEGFSSDRELEVRGAEDGSQVDLLIRRAGTGIFTTGIAIAPSDAPALALAILEAAGWPNEYLATTEILRRLRELDEHAKAVEAEARERAELEAEALELLNAEREEFNCTPVRDLSEVTARDQRAAIAVAKRAREMRAEK